MMLRTCDDVTWQVLGTDKGTALVQLWAPDGTTVTSEWDREALWDVLRELEATLQDWDRRGLRTA